ncbi:soluble TNF receptor II [BeAn 58058 virus]|uniref:soluble TNF receptor II n=1 Tax=BeAn 58058 virus TaxID=67082 RepID=UPI00090A105F|nr:soluble TNF receptor II [BeAn 58058 virus]APG58401.1 soluble TNF receptor II [BeAn 58058 virus]
MFIRTIIIYIIIQNVYTNKINYYPSIPLVTDDPSMFNYLGVEINLNTINDSNNSFCQQTNNKLHQYVFDTDYLNISIKLINYEIVFRHGIIAFVDNKVKMLLYTSTNIFQRRKDSYMNIEIVCKEFSKQLSLETNIYKNIFKTYQDNIKVYGNCLNSIDLYIRYKNTKTKTNYTKNVITNWLIIKQKK